jgi:hypothetical protein
MAAKIVRFMSELAANTTARNAIAFANATTDATATT